MIKLFAILLVITALVSVWGYDHYQPLVLELSPPDATLHCEIGEEGLAVHAPGQRVVASVAAFDDELYAYFNFDYLRTRSAVQPAEVLLTHRRHEEKPLPILVVPDNNLLTAIPFLESLKQQGYIPDYEWRFIAGLQLATYRQQTRVFDGAYSLPVRRRMETLSPAQKQDIVTRFVVFKSRTDPRVRKGIQPVPPTLTEAEARQLATDILTVADFFWLPLDFFLGIGAMENNYMNVPGDLEHAIWKSRPARDDIVLRRRNGRALVLNNASGVWQVTRETLRYAHKLYLEGEWDYTLLPDRLRPPEELRLDDVQPGHLTTYAGLLFRDLIDRFDGDVATAVGAYNGGPGNPNMGYEKGVRMVANYARRMLEQAARLNGQEVAETRFLAPSWKAGRAVSQ